MITDWLFIFPQVGSLNIKWKAFVSTNKTNRSALLYLSQTRAMYLVVGIQEGSSRVFPLDDWAFLGLNPSN